MISSTKRIAPGFLHDSFFKLRLQRRSAKHVSEQVAPKTWSSEFQSQPLIVRPLRPQGSSFRTIGCKQKDRLVNNATREIGQEFFGHLVHPVNIVDKERPAAFACSGL